MRASIVYAVLWIAWIVAFLAIEFTARSEQGKPGIHCQNSYGDWKTLTGRGRR